jgi:hypothetical protein
LNGEADRPGASAEVLHNAGKAISPRLSAFLNLVLAKSSKPKQNPHNRGDGLLERPLAATLAICALSCAAEAQPISRTVPAGQTTTVFTYRPYVRSSCKGAFAVATLAVKPQHGRVSHFLTPSTIPTFDRFAHRPSGCMATPTTGFAVTYTPAPGFHGTDTFSLDVNFKDAGRRETDSFTIVVQ